jgi:flagellar protein FlaG
MSNVSPAASIGDAGISVPPVVQPVTPVQSSVPDIENAADFRLVIEEDKATQSYIYKTIDRRTGEIVQQFPREEVVKLRDAEAYSAGAVIKASA